VVFDYKRFKFYDKILNQRKNLVIFYHENKKVSFCKKQV
jgi:hypothetical protein